MTILRRQFLNHVAQTSPSPMMVEVAHAKGTHFYTPERKRYIDLVAGVSVSNVGHCNEEVVAAVQKQAADYMHVMVYGELVERPQVEYATLLNNHLPEPLSSVYFVNSGAEAIDGAMKLARRYTARKEIISMRRAYHGSTQGAMSLMGSPDGDIWTEAFMPLIPECRSIDYNSFGDLSQITDKTAAVVCEPVQGEAGIRLPKDGYLKALRERCSEVGALLIFDEIQSGMGRCGEIFASIKYGVTPDIMTLAKAFGGGMPLGAFISSAEIMSALTHDPVLGHITTFGGHPVCCAAGMAALNYLINNNIVEQVEAKGASFESKLINHPLVQEIRRSGLLMAIELGKSEYLYQLMEIFKEMGIMSDWFLFCDTAFRISPPLTISEEEIDESCQLIIESLNKL